MKTQLIKTNAGLPSIQGRETPLEQWIDSFFSQSLFDSWNRVNLDLYPIDEYWDKEGILNIEIPLAGFKREDISIHIENGYLILQVKKQEARKDIVYINQGIRRKEIIRKWFLNDTFEHNTIKSQFIDGVLLIKITPKKKEEPKKHSINIE